MVTRRLPGLCCSVVQCVLQWVFAVCVAMCVAKDGRCFAQEPSALTFENGYQETPRSDQQMQRQQLQQQQQQQQLLQQVLPTLLCRFVWWHIFHMCACRHAKRRVAAYFLFSCFVHHFFLKTFYIHLRGFARK